MANVGITITEDTATPTLSKAARTLLEAKKRGALKAAERVRGVIDKEVRATYRSGSGRLAGSFKSTLLQATSSKVTSAALSDLSYAGVQNRGGTILPKTRKRLAIPLRQHERSNYIWPRNFSGGRLVYIKSKRGNELLALVSGKKIEPVYLLKPSVTLRGTNYLERARRKAVPVVQQAMGSEVKLAVRESGGR